MEQDGTINVNVIVSNPGFSHITERIFGHLDHKSQLQSRLVSQSWNNHVDQLHFWLKKLDKKGQSKELSKAWSDLFQKIETDSCLEEKLRKCLMKWYGNYHKWGKAQLEGISPIHIAARVGCVELVRFIASYSENPNIAKADGWSPIHAAAKNGHTNVLEFLASIVENPNAPNADGWTPIHLAAWKDILKLSNYWHPKQKIPMHQVLMDRLPLI